MIEPQPPTHAGGIVYRVTDGVPEFLLVTARGRSDEWVYPKGHIERGETAEHAAVREVREEAGVHADIIGPLSDLHIRLPHEDQIVRFFLMRTDDTGAPHEGRRAAWLSFEKALERLSFPDSRGVLRDAVELMRARAPR